MFVFFFFLCKYCFVDVLFVWLICSLFYVSMACFLMFCLVFLCGYYFVDVLFAFFLFVFYCWYYFIPRRMGKMDKVRLAIPFVKCLHTSDT